MAGEVEPAQREVADQVEDLVPGGFVREPHGIVDRPVSAEHEQVGRGEVPAHTHRPQPGGFRLCNERPALGEVGAERRRAYGDRVPLGRRSGRPRP